MSIIERKIELQSNEYLKIFDKNLENSYQN